MLAVKNQQLNSIFERILRDKNGALVRVRFTIVQVDGGFRPQIVSIIPVITKAEEPACLPCVSKRQVVIESLAPLFISKISPYFSLDYILTSQPTRAPSF